MFMIQIFPLEEDCLEFAGTEPIVCSYAYIYIYIYMKLLGPIGVC